MKIANKGIFFSDLSFFVKKKDFLVLSITSIIAIVSIITNVNLFGCEKFGYIEETSASDIAYTFNTDMDLEESVNQMRHFIMLAFDEQESFQDDDEQLPQKFVEPNLPKFFISKNIIQKCNPYGVNAFSLMLAYNLNDLSDLTGGAFYFRC